LQAKWIFSSELVGGCNQEIVSVLLQVS